MLIPYFKGKNSMYGADSNTWFAIFWIIFPILCSMTGKTSPLIMSIFWLTTSLAASSRAFCPLKRLSKYTLTCADLMLSWVLSILRYSMSFLKYRDPINLRRTLGLSGELKEVSNAYKFYMLHTNQWKLSNLLHLEEQKFLSSIPMSILRIHQCEEMKWLHQAGRNILN